MKSNGTKHGGIYFMKKASKWIARIRLAGCNCYIGSFGSYEQAETAYDTKHKKIFGA